MEPLIDSIRAAIAPNATEEIRAAGAVACCTILKALDRKPEELQPTTTPTLPIGSIVTALRGIPAEQLLEMAITRLRSMIPQGGEVRPNNVFKLQRVPVPGGAK